MTYEYIEALALTLTHHTNELRSQYLFQWIYDYLREKDKTAGYPPQADVHMVT